MTKKSRSRLAIMEAAGVVSGLIGVLLVRLLARPAPAAPRQETVKPVQAPQAPALPALRPGWHRTPGEPLPRPTFWPAALALGIVFVLWGVVTSYIVSGVGLILFVLALAGWIRELSFGD